MQEMSSTAEAAAAQVYWKAFAAEGAKVMKKDQELMARYEQLYPLHPLADARQPNPIRFYGPGPDGRVHPLDPPVGTLHFARWRHELAVGEDFKGGSYYDEQNPLIIKGQRSRPTYTTKGNQTAKEVNYFIWEKVTAESMKNVKTYPGPKASRAIHEEYLLNEDDFNQKVDQKSKISADLNNRLDEDIKDIYPLGYQLLKKWSKTNGHGEWEEGDCLGPNPHNPNALTKHLGWFPKRLRIAKAGLGADPQDVVWNEVFHGNLEAQPKEKFVPPKVKWAEDPDKVTILTSSINCCSVLQIVSLVSLKATLLPPESDTLNSRKMWLDARAPKRSKYQAITTMAPKEFDINKSTGLQPPLIKAILEAKSGGKGADIKREEVDDKSTTESNNTETSEQEKTPGANNIGEEDAYGEMEMALRDSPNEEREAIEAMLKELSLNPKPGCEGKKPIVIYSAFRSKFLGTPITQVLGYER